MPFFKRDKEEILQATAVTGPGFALEESKHDTYQYPVQGWYWFPNLDGALASELMLSTAQPTSRVISRRQAELVLFRAGLLTEVNEAVRASSIEVQISWNRASQFKRDDPMINGLAKKLGWPDSKVDQLFYVASMIPS